jgi:hypothetical protein
MNKNKIINYKVKFIFNINMKNNQIYYFMIKIN